MLKKRFDEKMIAKLTGLSKQEIEVLGNQNNLKDFFTILKI
jgi:hypothetical protein